MSRRKKVVEEQPEIIVENITPTVSNGEPEVVTTTVTEENYKLQTTPEVEETGVTNSPAPPTPPKIAATVETPYSPIPEIREIIRQTMANAPKRNDGTTMPAVVTLRCSAGDMYFLMPQFDAATVRSIWNRVKNKINPEEFVICLYTTMGLNPPKLYISREDLFIA